MKKIFLLFVSILVLSITASASDLMVQSGSGGKVIELTKSEFLKKVYDYEKNTDKWIYSGNKPAIIDFYADWCGPCRMMSPVLKSMAEKYKNNIVVYKINVDEEKELAAAFGITSLPTILFVPTSGKPHIVKGALPKDVMEKGIKEILLGKKSDK